MWVQAVQYNLFSVLFLLLDLSLLILSLPLLGLGSNSLSCFFLDDCLGKWSQWMELVPCSRRGMLTQVKHITIPTTTISIRLPHLCQWYYDHCVVTTNDGRMTRWLGGGIFYVSFGWQTRVGIIFFLFFVLLLCCCYLFCHGWYMIVLVPVSSDALCFLCLLLVLLIRHY